MDTITLASGTRLVLFHRTENPKTRVKFLVWDFFDTSITRNLTLVLPQSEEISNWQKISKNLTAVGVEPQGHVLYPVEVSDKDQLILGSISRDNPNYSNEISTISSRVMLGTANNVQDLNIQSLIEDFDQQLLRARG